MDDSVFNKKTALEWIAIIESENAKTRESDIYPLLSNWINSIAPIKILDIGCGQGVCSDKIDLEGRNYLGLDGSSFLIERAEQKYGNTNRQFIVGNIYELPFQDNEFDAVFSVALWHLLSDVKKAACELSRVLRKDGSFLIVTADPSSYSAWTAPYTDVKSDGNRFEGKMKLADGSDSTDILFLHTYDQISNSLQSNGLIIQKTEKFRNLIVFQGQKLISH